jgi:hypothetical protein
MQLPELVVVTKRVRSRLFAAGHEAPTAEARGARNLASVIGTHDEERPGMRSPSIRPQLVLAALLWAPGCVADLDASQPDDVAGQPEGPGAGGGSEEMHEAPVERILEHDYQVQETGYWCGPAAARVALSARMAPPTQQALANQLPTTTNGTDWIGQVTRTLNARLGGSYYATTEMPSDPPTAAQRERLWGDVRASIDANFPIVANIVAPPGNQPPGYPASQTIYHYFAVVGYNAKTRAIYVADSAAFSEKHYWLSFDQLATLIPPKGYSAMAPPDDEQIT